MQVDDTFDDVGRVDHNQRRNLLFLHHAEGADSQYFSGYGSRAGIHRIAGRLFQGIRAVAFEQTSQIAIADDADELAVQVNLGAAGMAGDDDLRAWLPAWRADGGDARRFRNGIAARFGGDEAEAWRYCEQVLTPLRPRIRQVARALLVHPRYLPSAVVTAVADSA